MERQRRARINRCLDELKELMTDALAAEQREASIGKLEKADVLELTVRHLQKLRRERILASNMAGASGRFRYGFTQYPRETSVALATTPVGDVSLGAHFNHLEQTLNEHDSATSTSDSNTAIRSYSLPGSLVSITDDYTVQQQSSLACWRPDYPLSIGYGSDNANTMGQESFKTLESSVWRPW